VNSRRLAAQAASNSRDGCQGRACQMPFVAEAAGLLFLPMQAFYRIRSPAEMSGRGKTQRRNLPGEDSIEPLPSPPCLRVSVVRFSAGRNHGVHGGTEPPSPRLRRPRERGGDRVNSRRLAAQAASNSRDGCQGRACQVPFVVGGGETPLSPHASVLSNTKPGEDIGQREDAAAEYAGRGFDRTSSLSSVPPRLGG